VLGSTASTIIEEVLNKADEEASSGMPLGKLSWKRLPVIARRLSMQLKAKVPAAKWSKANVLMINKEAADLVNSHQSMRASVKADLIPLVAVLYWLPTNGERLARDIAHSQAFREAVCDRYMIPKSGVLPCLARWLGLGGYERVEPPDE